MDVVVAIPTSTQAQYWMSRGPLMWVVVFIGLLPRNKVDRSVSELELTSIQVLPSTGSWKCQWNVTGTVLATSGDAGIVQLWKCNAQGEWKCVSQVHGDLPSAGNGVDAMMQG